MKKANPKIEIEEFNPELIEDMGSGILIDSVVDLLIKKKIITRKELEKQLEKSGEDVQKFIKNNPGIVQQLKEEIEQKRRDQMEYGGYIG